MSIKRMIAGFMCVALVLTSIIGSPGTVEAGKTKNAETKELYVGAGIADITPTADMLPMSQGLARQNLVSVVDPLHVRVIAMGYEENKPEALIVAWELGDTPSPTVYVDDLAKETGVDRDAIFYCATHSHAVPDAIKMTKDNPWMELAHEKMLEAADDAIKNMEAASVGIGKTNSYINVNRNQIYYKSDGTTERSQGYDPEGVSDKELALIRFDSKETKNPIAFVVNYAVHGVVMYANGEGVDEDGNPGVGISADLPGYVSTCLEKNFEDSVALWISGAAGNQNPIFGNEYFIPRTEEEITKDRNGNDVLNLVGSKKTETMGIGGKAVLELLGATQFRDVLRANASIKEMNSTVEINYGYGTKMIPSGQEGNDDFRVSLHMLRFGDIALLGSGGELFCEYGLTLKKESPLENTLVVNNAATHGSTDDLDVKNEEPEYRTYMCTDEDIKIGSGQGVKATIYKPGYMSNALVSLMNNLLGDAQTTAKTAQEYYNEGQKIKNEGGTFAYEGVEERYQAALEQYMLGAAVDYGTDEAEKSAVANCLVQIGECCVYLEKGPNGETGSALRDYVFDSWKRAGDLGEGAGYFDLGLAYVGIEIPGAGTGECLGMANTAEEQKTGFAYLVQAEELGNGKAKRYQGVCYYYGYGVEQDYDKSYEFGNRPSQYQLFGLGSIEQDVEAAIAAFDKSARSTGGNRTTAQTARLILAELYYTGSYSEDLPDGTTGKVTIDEIDQEKALEYLKLNKEEFKLSDSDIDEIIAGFEAKSSVKTAQDYYNEGQKIKNEGGTFAYEGVEERYQAALEQYMLGAAVDYGTDAAEKSAVANCLVQIGECCVYLEEGPNGETGSALKDYVFDAWKRAGELGEGAGYFDLGLAYVGIEIPGAGTGECLGMANTAEEQKTGFAYLVQAEELGNGKAKRYQGVCYYYGYGVEQDYDKSYEFGNRPSQYQLFGLGSIEQDVEAAIAAFDKSARSTGGNRTTAQTARLILAELYYTGSYSEDLPDGTTGKITIAEIDQEKALEYLNLNKEEFKLSDSDIDEIIAGFEAKSSVKTAQDYYNEGQEIKNAGGTFAYAGVEERYQAALEKYVLGAAVEFDDADAAEKKAVANCLVQIGECCVYLGKGPKGETGSALKDYVFDCWNRAGELGEGTGYFDIALAYIGFDIPGAGTGECLGLAHDDEQQKMGVSYLEKALELKNGKAQRYIGMCYHFGYGVDQSFEKAYECFSKTNGAELYIAKYKLFGVGGLDQDVEGGIALLTPKAESLKGGNRTEAETSRMILAELYYTGSYSEVLPDKTNRTVTLDKLDQEKALEYLVLNKAEFNLSDTVVNAIVAGYEVKNGKADAADAEIKEAQATIDKLQGELKTAQDEVEKVQQELENAQKEGSVSADKANELQNKLNASEQTAADLKNTIAQNEAALKAVQAQVTGLQQQLGAAQNQKVRIITDKKKYTVKAGKKVSIIAVASDGGKLTYKTKNKKIAKVNKKGKITGVKKGSTKIVIKSGSTQITVTVKVK